NLGLQLPYGPKPIIVTAREGSAAADPRTEPTLCRSPVEAQQRLHQKSSRVPLASTTQQSPTWRLNCSPTQ
ncbi:hypothetical protein Tco_0518829, partial [Tanacetum coccineum]